MGSAMDLQIQTQPDEARSRSSADWSYFAKNGYYFGAVWLYDDTYYTRKIVSEMRSRKTDGGSYLAPDFD
jgi:hypothetical protein